MEIQFIIITILLAALVFGLVITIIFWLFGFDKIAKNQQTIIDKLNNRN